MRNQQRQTKFQAT